MTTPRKTHRVNPRPSISARFLADYMAASETKRRSIVRGCKYPPIAKLVQHDHAKSAISHFFVTASAPAGLSARAAGLREQMADDDFDRDVMDHNADYIDRFVATHTLLDLPDAEILAPGKTGALEHHGVRVTTELSFRMRRVMRNNRVRIGAAMLRYAKGKALDPEVALWQSAWLMGYLEATQDNPSEVPERRLCSTIDAYSGTSFSAPGDSARRFLNMQAALTSIAERWPNIPPPPGAVL